ncbi:MAG: 50S ribosomal protein L13 [Gammaproteobacteria bacterium]|uniref:Large ribosomal subunit protein uL13 n=1 Tax=SAR86 cluster bacterium TaxID=2030880 RepID=A0A520N1N5_9GAMM|nr:50S ribosomal protein L13 [Gammaproteobacteria bacterium]RPG34919.1 MAG: 50S ribosomal protein L13 [Gammaproteobacteria bacterium TMED193]RZO27345.1 MAG: 50S ribosomal protein L13 [SAR86 cluster bacterium]|tara:strand:- start:44 stop:469 length:426 start_codon:yes stop_codon:yes gene_type:complete
MKTTALRSQDIEQKWYLIDCSEKTLGRLSVRVANILRGKTKPEYTPNADVGDFVILINAKNIKVTGSKTDDKVYYSHSGYPGGIKQINFKNLLEKDPEKVLRNSIKGMLPKNRLNRQIIKKLKIYADEIHPHEAQNPEVIS